MWHQSFNWFGFKTSNLSILLTLMSLTLHIRRHGYSKHFNFVIFINFITFVCILFWICSQIISSIYSNFEFVLRDVFYQYEWMFVLVIKKKRWWIYIFCLNLLLKNTYNYNYFILVWINSIYPFYHVILYLLFMNKKKYMSLKEIKVILKVSKLILVQNSIS